MFDVATIQSKQFQVFSRFVTIHDRDRWQKDKTAFLFVDQSSSKFLYYTEQRDKQIRQRTSDENNRYDQLWLKI